MKRINIFSIILCLSIMAAPAVYAYGFEDMEGVDIHGFISQGYLHSTDNNWMGASENGTWQFNELGLNFTSMLTDRLRIGMQFFARDIGIIGNDEIIVDWAYADFHIKDWFGIRAGQMKNPMSLYNETRDIDFLRNSVFLPHPMYNEGARDSILQTKGIGIYGTIDARVIGLFRYLGLYGTTGIDVEGGSARFFEESATAASLNMLGPGSGLLSALIKGDITAFDVEQTYTISLDWQLPVEGLRIAGSFSRIDMKMDLSFSLAGTPFMQAPDTLMESEIWIASIEYMWYDLLLSAEFLRAYAGYGLHMQGWYTMASYRLFDWFAFGIYYCEYYPDDSDKHGRAPGLIADYQAWTKTIAGFVRFDINENWLVKAEYQYNNGVSQLSRLDNLNNAGFASFDQYWDLLAFKVTFNF